VAYRYNGASEAARYGAVASLVRSVGPYGIQTPHTGGMGYNDSLPKIASAAITIEDALLLQRMQDRGQEPELTLTMEAHWEPDAPSRNVIIEIPGRELPNEVVVMGGHIDSWDVGTGAMDDAGGCFITWRALVHMRNLGLVPKRTIRVCFWTNEENGLRGGTTYSDSTMNEKHFMAMESDGGTFKPVGFSTSAKGQLRSNLEDVSALLDVVGASALRDGSGGADTSPLHRRGVDVMELVTEGNYFWYHHTHADTVDKLDPRDVAMNVAAIAVMAYLIAEIPERLPR
jgi:carboxypeptidase Q